MPIGVPSLVGSVSTGSGNTIVVPVTNAIIAGNLVVVAFVSDRQAANTITAVSDGTNSYTKPNSVTFGSDPVDLSVWSIPAAQAVASGNITATVGTGTPTNAVWLGIAAQISGILQSSPLDANVTGTNANTATTSISVSSGALAQGLEVVVCAVGISIAEAITASSGFTQMVAGGVSGNGALSLEYKLVNSTSAATFNPSFGSAKNAAIVTSFKSDNWLGGFQQFNTPGPRVVIAVPY